MWSAQNTALDHIFDHLQTRTTWKQCSQEHTKAPFLDTKAPKITRNYTKNLCICVRDAKVVGSNPVASTKNNGQHSRYPLFFCCVFCLQIKVFQRFLSFAKSHIIFPQKICIRQSFAKLISYHNILCLRFLLFILKTISST